MYANLLALSGFSGAVCWISICWSQLNFRRTLEQKSDSDTILSYKVKAFPYLTHLGIWLQVACLLLVLFNPNLRSSFYFGIPVLLIPMLIYKRLNKQPKAPITL
jgi:AAT family amino acid transporter